MPKIVNSWNEWDPLKRVIVGRPEGTNVPAPEPAHCEQLDKLGFEVIPIPYEKVAPFGGCLHCTTLDIYREGKLEDYFPHQIDGY